MGTRMVDDTHALGSSVAEEVDIVAVEIAAIGVGINHVGSHGAHLAQRAVEDLCIHFHAPGINHRAEQRVVGQAVEWQLGHLAQQQRHSQQLQRGHREQLQVAPEAQPLGHRHADAQTCVGAGAAAHSHCIEGNGMAVGKRHGLVDIQAQHHRVVGAAVVLF